MNDAARRPHAVIPCATWVPPPDQASAWQCAVTGSGARPAPTSPQSTRPSHISEIATWTVLTYGAQGYLTSAKRVRDFASQAGPSIEYDYNDTANNVLGLNPVTVTRRGDKDGNGSIDPPGNVTIITDYPGDHPATPERVSIRTYDELDRPLRAVGPVYTDATLGPIRPVTRYIYDNLGNLSQVQAGRTDAGGITPANDNVAVQATYVHDDFGRRLRETDPLARAQNRTYDLNGNVLTQTDAKSQTTTFTWGYGGQLLTRASHTGAAGNLILTRNNLGLVTRIANSAPAMPIQDH